jgi:hypothetical protein
MDTFRVGLEYKSSGLPVRVTGARGLRLGDTSIDPVTRKHTFWFKDLATWEQHREDIFSSLGRHAVNFPIPRFEPIGKALVAESEAQAIADIEAGQKAPATPIGASFFFLVGVALACLRANDTKKREQAAAKAEADAKKAEQDALEKLRLEAEAIEQQEAAKGVMIAQEGKELPADASPATRKAYEQTREALKGLEAALEEPKPTELPPAAVVDSGEPPVEIQSTPPVAEAPEGKPQEQTQPEAKAEEAPNVGESGYTATELAELISMSLAERGHRVGDLSEALNLPEALLHDFITKDGSGFYIASGGWVKSGAAPTE